jgi:hypothetical protein
MKLKILSVLLVCLTANSAFAAGPAWVGPTGNWNEAAKWNPAAVPSLADTNEIKDTVASSQITVNTDIGVYAGKVTIGAGPDESKAAKLYVQTNGHIGSATELKISDTGAGGSGGKYGYLIQTGGTVDTGSAGKVEVGYKAGGIGYYTISGGSLIMTASTSTSQLFVGGSGAVGSTGTFDVIGTDPVISLYKLLVGVKDSSGGNNGTGTMKFESSSPGSGVSSIELTNTGTGVYIDPVNNAVANLDVASLVISSTAVPSAIVLIETIGTGAVVGDFDTVFYAGGSGSGAESSAVMLYDELNNLHQYTLTYLYNANGDDKTNDIALIPEPATIALLALGLLAIRRR